MGSARGGGVGRGDALPLGAPSYRAWSNCGSVAPRIRAQPGPLGVGSLAGADRVPRGVRRPQALVGRRLRGGQGRGWEPLWEPQPGTGRAPGPPCANGAPRRESCERTGRGTRAGTEQSGARTSRHCPLPSPLPAPGPPSATRCHPFWLKRATALCALGFAWGRGCCRFQARPGWGGLCLLSPPPDTQVANPPPSMAMIPHLPGPSWTRSCGGGAGTGSGEVVDAGQILDAGELPDDPRSEDAGLALPRNSLLIPAAPAPASSFALGAGTAGASGPPLLPRLPLRQEPHSRLPSLRLGGRGSWSALLS